MASGRGRFSAIRRDSEFAHRARQRVGSAGEPVTEGGSPPRRQLICSVRRELCALPRIGHSRSSTEEVDELLVGLSAKRKFVVPLPARTALGTAASAAAGRARDALALDVVLVAGGAG